MRLLVIGVIGGLVIFFLLTGEGPSSLINRISVFLRGPGFALDTFPDSVPVYRVLASEGWNSRDPLQPKCSIAIIELSVSAPVVPPKMPLIEQATTRFGGNWVATPETRRFPRSKDVMVLCGDRIWSGVRRDLEHALKQPGSFVIRDWKSDILQIYAPNRGLAAYLHFGLALD